MNVKNCPGCANVEGTLVGAIGQPLSVMIKGSTYLQPEYRIRCCSHCGLHYKTNVLDGQQLVDYYGQVDFMKWDIGKLYPTERIMKIFLKRLPTGNRILDFGCSIGRLLTHLLVNYDCYGVEINQEAAQIAASRGIKMLAKHEWMHQQFDAVILNDVFEHLTHPTALLDQLCQCLSPNGYLLISTGNADAQACERDIANFWYFRNLEHLCMLNRDYVEFVAKKFNLHLVLWQESSHYHYNFSKLVREKVATFAYWQFHAASNSMIPKILQFIPRVRNAKNWNLPPYFAHTRDHVVVSLQQKD